jgi:hypothetical protein
VYGSKASLPVRRGTWRMVRIVSNVWHRYSSRLGRALPGNQTTL